MLGSDFMQAFFETVESDPRIGQKHICLYLALAFEKFKRGSEDDFEIVRAETMRWAKISARSTFDICIHELEDFGYIRYEPSNSCAVKSRVSLKKL